MGTVDFSGSGTSTLTVSVTLVSSLKFVSSGLQYTIDFNLSGSPTISLVSTSDSDFTLTSTSAGSRHFDGFGNFLYSLQLPGNGSGSSQFSPETFKISCCPVCTVAANSGGYFFGVDVYNTVNGNTGPIGTNHDSPATPEATSIAFYGSGLLTCGWVLRRRLKAVW